MVSTLATAHSNKPKCFHAHAHLVSDALEVLVNLSHRSACCEDIGDGAGILTEIPHEFFAAEASRLGKKLPTKGDYGVGMIFINKSDFQADQAKAIIEKSIAHLGLEVLFWRQVPTNDAR